MAAQNENFMVLSHDSNKHFLNPLLKEANFAKVKWFNESLYSGESNQFDGEWLLIDRLGYVKGIIPVEYLKDEMIFNMFLPEFSDVNISKQRR